LCCPPTPNAPSAIKTLLESEGLDDPDSPQWVILSREVRLNGRNICRINGRSVSLQMLAEVAGLLVDVHGQGEHLGLLQPKTHVHLLDRYGALLPLRAQVAERVAELRRIRSELQKLRQDARTIAQRLDMLSFQVDEITAAALRPGEDGELESERRRLGNAEALTSLAQTASGILSQGDGELPGAIDMVSEAVGRLEKLARIDPDMAPHADEGQALIEQLSDLARTLQDYADALEFNPVRLAEVEERLELIASLKRKYGDTIEQINAFGEKARRELEELSNWEAKTADLEQREASLLRVVGKLGAELSQKRQAAGETLARQVEQELADLKMVRARFGVAITQAAHAEGAYLPDGRRVAFDSTGVDQVEFLISANPGEPLKPMARVASGGETARLMLALKSTLAHADATPTLIFDEIDQGIGGRVGAIVGQKLWRLTGAAPGAEWRRRRRPSSALHNAPAAACRVWRPSLHRQQADSGAGRRRTHAHRRRDAGGGGAHRRTDADARRAQ
jgi:DNA repair protein RecN (Recombination protein N)